MLEKLSLYTESPAGYIGDEREILKVISVGVIVSLCSYLFGKTFETDGG